MKRVVSFFALGIFAAGVTVACGARGPLDLPDIVYVAADAADEAATDVDASGTTTDDASTIKEGGASKDAGTDASNPINCAVCVGQTCSNQILACVTNQACLSTLQCVFGQCLTGGSVNPACALACSGEGGPQGILDVLAILQCVTTSCGPDCSSVLGGLGAGLGGGAGP